MYLSYCGNEYAVLHACELIWHANLLYVIKIQRESFVRSDYVWESSVGCSINKMINWSEYSRQYRYNDTADSFSYCNQT